MLATAPSQLVFELQSLYINLALPALWLVVECLASMFIPNTIMRDYLVSILPLATNYILKYVMGRHSRVKHPGNHELITNWGNVVPSSTHPSWGWLNSYALAHPLRNISARCKLINRIIRWWLKKLLLKMCLIWAAILPGTLTTKKIQDRTISKTPMKARLSWKIVFH